MKQIEIYMRADCGYCDAAKRLLGRKGVSYAEFDIWSDPTIQAEMMQRSKVARTVRQIFVGDVFVGGCDELGALERAGRLDAILAT